jgi:hypothetical protein
MYLQHEQTLEPSTSASPKTEPRSIYSANPYRSSLDRNSCAPRPRSKHNRSSPNRQPQQHSRTRRKQVEPDHNPVAQRVHKRMHNPDAHIPPRRSHGRSVADSQVRESQNGADEVRRLLVQVVEVLRGPLQVWRQHFLHSRGGERRVRGDFVFAQGGEAFGEHPAFHYEGPEVEGYLLGWVLVGGLYCLLGI